MARIPTILEFCRDVNKEIKVGNKIADTDGEIYVVRHVSSGHVKAVKFTYDNPLYTFKKSSVYKID